MMTERTRRLKNKQRIAKTAFVFIVLFLPLLSACSRTAPDRIGNTGYRYEAVSDNYRYVITSDSLEITRLDDMWCGEKITVSGGVADFCGLKGKLFPGASVLRVSELLYKIFMGETDTETERTGDFFVITGTWYYPFTLKLDKKSFEPRSLTWLGENIVFE